MPGTPYVGQLMLAGFNFAPVGWALCNGQLLAIAENETLFALIGTTYGGDGATTFALPDLQGRVPIHQGQGPVSNYIIGQNGGAENITLISSQMPVHSHNLNEVAANSNSKSPVGAVAFGN